MNLVAGALGLLTGCISPFPVEPMQSMNDQPPPQTITNGFTAASPGVSDELPYDATDDLGDREKSGPHLANADTAQPPQPMTATSGWQSDPRCSWIIV